MTYPAHGGAVNAWDTPLNTDFDQIDTMVGGTLPLVLGSSVATVTLTAQQTWYQQFALSGVLVGATTITLLSSVSGGIYCFDNQTTGGFSVSVTTSSSLAGTAQVIPQGGHTLVRCDGTSVALADDTAQASLNTEVGSPQGALAGTAGVSNGDSTDVVWDATNKILYAAQQSGTAATTIWMPVGGGLQPQGILTALNNASNPIPTVDVLASTNIYYFPYTGNWTWLANGNGTALFSYQFTAQTLALTTSQAANQIYDIFMTRDVTAGVVIGTGPSWSAGGGSVAAGAGARGTGAGSTAISRLQGIWVNTVGMTLTNGLSTYAIAAAAGVYLGSIFMDASAGQVTCHRTFGQSRKWGVFNAYNRVPVYLKAGDTGGSWNYTTFTFRAQNGNSANSATVFQGLAEEICDVRFMASALNSTATAFFQSGIGLNSTTTASGVAGGMVANAGQQLATSPASYMSPPFLGINNFICLERSQAVGGATWFGGEDDTLMTAQWRA